MSTPTWDRVFDHIDGGTGQLREWVAAVVAKKPSRLHDPTAQPRRRFLYLYSASPGTGKSIFHEAVALLIPERVIRMDFVLRNTFVAELATAHPLCVLEATWFGRDRWVLGRFKDWINRPEIVVHRQCEAPITVVNTTSWVQCGQSLRDCPASRLPGADFLSTIRHRAKKPMNLEVASEACMQAFGTSPSRKRLEDKPLETPQFPAGF